MSKRVRVGMGLTFVVVTLLAVGLLASVLAGRAETNDPASGTSTSNPEGVEAGATGTPSTARTVVADGVTWTVARGDSSDGPCIEVIPKVDGVELGGVGSCGASDNPLLRWGIGGIAIGGQWFNVAYGEVPPPAASVRLTLGDGTVRTDSDIRTSGGMWVAVIAGDPTDFASEVTRIEVLDASGSVITSEVPPSLAAYRLQAQQISHPHK